MSVPAPSGYRLVAAEPPAAEPELDGAQQAVVLHESGPLLVLAGPGTGKTTTLVQAIADRVERRGAEPDQVLALTFSRKAAEQLRDRVTTRLGRTLTTPLAATFHSFAYGLLNTYASGELYGDVNQGPLRLLSAAEQDVVIRELLTGPDAVSWPDSFKQALGTRGFASEVAALLSRTREKGLDGEELSLLGWQTDHAEWIGGGQFLERYLDVLDSLGAIDYADLIRRAVLIAHEHRAALRERFRHVFVDEYQDTDPSQVALLSLLAGDGGNLVVVGDPHQSIYAFRGAEVRGIMEFPHAFRTREGSPAPVIALSTTRRFGPGVLEAATRVASRLPLPAGIGEEQRRQFARPTSALAEPGTVEVATYETERAEAEHIADHLRRAHAEDGIEWSEMAVLVRSGRATLPRLRRALAAADVPVEVASDDTALAEEPAVKHLMTAATTADRLAAAQRAQSPLTLSATEARELLASPLAGLDAADVRVLARTLRTAEVAQCAETGTPARSSAQLLVAALAETASVDLERLASSTPAARRALALSRLLRTAAEEIADNARAEQVLWTLWAGTGWPERLVENSTGRGAQARAAHRDLDALCALFEQAARSEQHREFAGVREFAETLLAQRIPADTLAERGVRGQAVRLMTAHRAKGLEWDLVVVAHVQEETWPDLRRRATLLDVDRVGPEGLTDPRTTRELLADERRLFYVALTRARRRLLVTAVASHEDDGEQPSRFLAELGVVIPEKPARRPARPLSVSGLVARLRRAAADTDAPTELRDAAAARLATLVTAHRERRIWAPAADPATWWGSRAQSRSSRPLRPTDEPLRITASTLTNLEACPMQWFLTAEAGGSGAATQSQGFGNIVHALGDRIGKGEIAADTSAAEIMDYVDEVWAQIPFRTPWSSQSERQECEQALERLLAWHQREGAREILSTERRIGAEVKLSDDLTVRLDGYADRIELDAEGRVVVIDLKTGKYPPTREQVVVHPQLGLYQLAVENGAVDDLVPDAAAGGAELWQLRAAPTGKVKVQSQAPQEPDEEGLRPIEQQLIAAADALGEERFVARPGKHCDYCEFKRLCPAKNSSGVIS